VVPIVLNVLVPDVLACRSCTPAPTAPRHQHASTNCTISTF